MQKKLGIILSAVFLFVIILGFFLVLIPFSFDNEVKSTSFVIEVGDGARTIADNLYRRGIINTPNIFLLYSFLTGNEKSFKAGEYVLDSPISIRGVVRSFTKGLSESTDVSVTIPEGSTIADIDFLFAKSGLTERGDFLTDEILELEGFLFPDTYRFRNNEQLDDIVQKMRNEFVKKTGEPIDKETLIIASILEREVKTSQDMRIVAGIIQKRSDIGMPLQIDATVAYGVCWRQYLIGKTCDTSLVNLVDNIPRDSAYNTYTRVGLPQGPISNPGLRAIEAALDPISSDFLYYLSAKDGKTIFSRNITEHNVARNKHIL